MSIIQIIAIVVTAGICVLFGFIKEVKKSSNLPYENEEDEDEFLFEAMVAGVFDDED